MKRDMTTALIEWAKARDLDPTSPNTYLELESVCGNTSAAAPAKTVEAALEHLSTSVQRNAK